MDSGNSPHNRKGLNTRLVPPGGPADPPETSRRRTIVIVTALFTILLGAAVGVLVFLPADDIQTVSAPPLEEKQVVPAPAELSTTPEESQQSKAVVPAESAAANQAREQVWALKIEAEAQRTSEWGEDSYKQIMMQLEEADTLLSEGAFTSATAQYQTIRADLQSLLDSKSERYQQALTAGQRGLMEEQPEAAGEHFRRALMLEPSSRDAQAGLEQAEKLATLLAGYRNALLLEEQGRLEEALEQLDLLVKQGTIYDPADKARKRIQDKMDELVFEREMNKLYSALEAQDFSSARNSVQILEQLGVHLQEVEQAAALMAERQTRAEIERLKGEAENYRDGEQWQRALDAYERILRLDSNLLFATAGQEEAARRVELDTSMRDAIDRPQRLQDEGQQAAAAGLLSYARQIQPRGPRLESQIESLETQLKTARTPVPVTLESDNQTHVTIYHVGRLAPFLTKTIILKPGTYTVVGSRSGYRDVRKKITISMDGSEHRYDIRCEDAI